MMALGLECRNRKVTDDSENVIRLETNKVYNLIELQERFKKGNCIEVEA